MKRGYILLFLAVWFFLSSLSFGAEDYYFIIRVDDIQSRINWEPRRIIDFEEALEARGAKISWAVIPHRLIESQNADGVLAEDLRQSIADGHEIVLHGYVHICPLCSQSSHEMYCTFYNTAHSYETQSGMIRDGLQLLTDSVGYTPLAFVPPGHHADTTTYQVLLDSEFKWISTTGATKDTIYKNLFNLAPHNEYTWYLTDADYDNKLNQALADIDSKFESQGYYCLLLHDPFTRSGYEEGLVIDWTAELLDSLNARYGEKLKYKTLSETAAIFADSVATFVNAPQTVPQSAQLFQNYPNPFNPQTTIRYALHQAANVELAVYNLLGQKVAVLVSGRQPAGVYTAVFDGASLSSGVYIYELKTAESISRKRMLLLR